MQSHIFSDTSSLIKYYIKYHNRQPYKPEALYYQNYTKINKMSTLPKPFVFVLMPFNERYDDVYHLGIKAACETAGSYCERVDEQIFHESILDRIYNQISKADLVISDMSDRNANVFYETGYAHALGKKVILLTQNSDDIPFDLKHYPHIIYDGKITKLKDALVERIGWFLKQDNSVNLGSLSWLDKLQLYVNRMKFVEGSIVDVGFESKYDRSLVIELAWTNNNQYPIQLPETTVGIIVSGEMMPDREVHNNGIVLPDGDWYFSTQIEADTIHPQDWVGTYFSTWTQLEEHPSYLSNKPLTFPAKFRFFSNSGSKDVNFTIRFSP